MVDNLTDDDAEEVIRQFAEITETDEAFAHFMLQDDNFDLDRTLSRYYSAQDPETVYRKFRIENGDEEDNSGSGAGTSNEAKQPPKKRARVTDSQFPAELTVLSWNVDGINSAGLEKRFLAVLYVIAKTNPEVIFLQEMVEEVMQQLNKLMTPMYNMVVSGPSPGAHYFCVTLISKNITLTHSEVVPFPNTQMGRSMTVIQARWQRLYLVLINAHLESMRDHSEIRKMQYKSCMQKMKSLIDTNPEETLVLFGGDLNIRDKEIEDVRKMVDIPATIRDAWEAAGSETNARFTWDMCRNDNYTNNGRARCRFDRLYFSGPYEDVDFKLEGTSRVKDVNMFASDHFAIICRFTSPKNTADEGKGASAKPKMEA